MVEELVPYVAYGGVFEQVFDKVSWGERENVCRVEVIKRAVSIANLGSRLDACFDVATSTADGRGNIGALS